MGLYGTSDERWRAVTARDAAADGSFCYAVRTTGVFCRPSCGARRPLRRNVEFFDGPAAAERAGYRACRRCAPGAPDPRSETTALLVRACRLLAREEGIGTRALARRLGLDVFTFQRAFRRTVGVAPQAYRRRLLSERARQELGSPAATSVSSAVLAAGYSSPSRFYEGVGRELGMSPRQARAGGRGVSVRYALRPCALGVVLVAWTDRGVCDVRFGDDEEGPARGLRARFPQAALERGAVPPWVNEVVELVERPRRSDVPLDIQGTAFQQRVWAELRRIPAGETRTYSQIAVALGAPSSARAVAGACAANSLAVLVPCHRVIRGSGDLSGYRWGVARKRELLRREAASASALTLRSS